MIRFGELREWWWPGDPLTAAPDPLDAPADPMQLGSAAKRLLGDPVLALAFERVREDLVASWCNSRGDQREHREEAYRLLWALEAVRGKLSNMVGNRRQLEEALKAKDAERVRREQRGL